MSRTYTNLLFHVVYSTKYRKLRKDGATDEHGYEGSFSIEFILRKPPALLEVTHVGKKARKIIEPTK